MKKAVLVFFTVMSVVNVIYSMLLFQQHFMLLTGPVLLVPPVYIGVEVVLMVMLVFYCFVLFAHFFNGVLNEVGGVSSGG